MESREKSRYKDIKERGEGKKRKVAPSTSLFGLYCRSHVWPKLAIVIMPGGRVPQAEEGGWHEVVPDQVRRHPAQLTSDPALCKKAAALSAKNQVLVSKTGRFPVNSCHNMRQHLYRCFGTAPPTSERILNTSYFQFAPSCCPRLHYVSACLVFVWCVQACSRLRIVLF